MLQQKVSDRLVAQVEVNAFIRETDFDARFDVGTASQRNALPKHVPGCKAGEDVQGGWLEDEPDPWLYRPGRPPSPAEGSPPRLPRWSFPLPVRQLPV